MMERRNGLLAVVLISSSVLLTGCLTTLPQYPSAAQARQLNLPAVDSAPITQPTAAASLKENVSALVRQDRAETEAAENDAEPLLEAPELDDEFVPEVETVSSYQPLVEDSSGVEAQAPMVQAPPARVASAPSQPVRTNKSGDHKYLIAPGDSVNVMVWRNPEVSMAVQVRPDGKITTPLVEDMQASGKTSSQLARDIELALSKYIRDPIVTVVVTTMLGSYDEQVRVIGQAAKPQALAYRENMSVLDVLIAVGGMTEFAAGNKASIIRKHGGQQQTISVRLDDLINAGDISANIPVRPGDILVIPESFF